MAKAYVYSFGPFEVRTDSRELQKCGTNIRLRGQPFLVLNTLLERAGEVVTREELHERIWASDTFVDFEHGLNTSIKKVRQVLCDSPVEPRYVETLPKIGYRFIAPVEVREAASGNVFHSTGTSALAPAPLSLSEPRTEVQPSESQEAPAPIAFILPRPTPERPNLDWLRAHKLRIAAVATVTVLTVAIWAHGGVSLLDLNNGWFARPTVYTSLAVLPLQSLSSDPNQDYFADGITDEIITNFAQSGGLRVISRTSVMRYKSTNKSSREIGKELHADALMEGTIERVGSRVRLRIQLIDAVRDRTLWAHIYDRELSDVLSLESSVARDIVEQVSGEMSAQAAGKSKTVNPEAYEAYLKGRYFWNKRSSEALSKSIEFFQQAVSLDPKLAVAYAGLADAYSILGSDVLPAAIAQSRAREAADKAITLDPSLAEGHAARGLVAFYYDWDWKKAGAELKTALQLNPNYATAHQWYSYYLGAMQRFPEAMQEAQRAQELDPLSLSIVATLAAEYLANQRYDEAIITSNKIIEMDPTFVPAHRCLAKVYLNKKMWPEALQELEKNVDLSPDSARTLADLAYGLAVAGKRADARKILQNLQGLSWKQYVSPFEIAKVYVALNDHHDALLNLEKSYAEHESQIPFLDVTMALYPLHSEPQFRALVRRIGLPQADATA